MMICDADFEELFGPSFRKSRQKAPARKPDAPSKPTVACSKDDVGKTPAASPRSKAVIARPTHRGNGSADPAQAAMAAAMMPSMAAYGVTLAALSSYERMMNA